MESPATTSQSASPEQMMDVEVKEEPDELQDFYFDADGSLLPKEETDPIYGDYQNPNDTADIDDKDDLDLDDDKKSDLDLDEDRKSDLDLDDNKKSDQDPSEQEIDTKKASLPAGLCVIETKEDTINNILMANVVKTKIFLAKGTLFGPFPDLNPSASVKPREEVGSKSNRMAGELSNIKIVRTSCGEIYYELARDIHPDRFKDQQESTAMSLEMIARKNSPWTVMPSYQRQAGQMPKAVIKLNRIPDRSLKNTVKFEDYSCESGDEKIPTEKPLVTELKFTCDTCKKTFPSKRGLAIHKFALHSDPLKCPICEESFSTRPDLEKHKVFNHWDVESDKTKEMTTFGRHQFSHRRVKKNYSCSHCDKVFDKIGDLRFHVVEHTGVMPFQCNHCDKGFLLKAHLTQHSYSHNKDRSTKRFKCSVCSKGFSFKQSLVVHERFHKEGPQPSKCHPKDKLCPVCGKLFTIQTIYHHKRTHLSTDYERKHECSQCGKCFKRKSHLRDHITRGPHAERKYQCTQCGKRFRQIAHLKDHEGTHGGRLRQDYPCPDCGKVLARKSGLVEHQARMHSGVRAHSCNICEHRFTTLKDLRRHMKIHDAEHSGVPGPKCPECGKIFKLEEGLKRHLRRIHAKSEGNFPCSECGKFFHCLSYLEEHRLTHKYKKIRKIIPTEKKRTVQCSECPMTFPSQTNLRYHMLKHTGEKPHQCSDCGKRFSLLGNLKTHQRYHTGEKPFKCTECDMSFLKKVQLLFHMETHDSRTLSPGASF